MTTEYLIVVQQLWLNETGHGTDYHRFGRPHADRSKAIQAALDDLDHDDFSVATVVDGRIVAFGWMFDDFGVEDGEPHGGHDLAEIARQVGMNSGASR